MSALGHGGHFTASLPEDGVSSGPDNLPLVSRLGLDWCRNLDVAACWALFISRKVSPPGQILIHPAIGLVNPAQEGEVGIEQGSRLETFIAIGCQQVGDAGQWVAVAKAGVFTKVSIAFAPAIPGHAAPNVPLRLKSGTPFYAKTGTFQWAKIAQSL